MENLITVVVDAMGGDNAPHEIIKGAVEAVKEKQNLKVNIDEKLKGCD